MDVLHLERGEGQKRPALIDLLVEKEKQRTRIHRRPEDFILFGKSLVSHEQDPGVAFSRVLKVVPWRVLLLYMGLTDMVEDLAEYATAAEFVGATTTVVLSLRSQFTTKQLELIEATDCIGHVYLTHPPFCYSWPKMSCIRDS